VASRSTGQRHGLRAPLPQLSGVDFERGAVGAAAAATVGGGVVIKTYLRDASLIWLVFLGIALMGAH